MTRNVEIMGNTAIIGTDPMTVRALSHEGKTYFAACDVLKACGISAPARWVARNRGKRLHPRKFPFTMKTKKGPRTVEMYFYTAEEARFAIGNTYCEKEIGQFLVKQCLTFRFNGEPQGKELPSEDVNRDFVATLWEGEKKHNQQELIAQEPENLNAMDIVKQWDDTKMTASIDRVIVALLELRQNICLSTKTAL